MKTTRQLKDLIRNVARDKDINAQLLMRNYMLERLLERISLSELKDKFILKGGMLVAALVGIDMRSTMDMDATIKGYPVTETALREVFEKILSVTVDDGVQMTLTKIETIRDEDEYNGYRLTINSNLENMRVPLKVDITTGDEITPREVSYTFDLLLENRTIEILAYNIESVLAEKLETIISRGLANTRMRDFYDIHILLATQSERIEKSVLVSAVQATAEKRGSVHLLKDGLEILNEVFGSSDSEKKWTRYQKQFVYADEITWDEIKQATLKLWSLMEDLFE
ncbi:nucleotidyl transferase AbiEii/AbiGii toxin family protein [Sporosarcina sp. FSL K6-3457]|uniref:nucleotidyl transferase AbiEii/AbiGii toxin family protein n=1 Tax=Sporosarcina sp. FSL K6-3457 TaxID=2978204 RepID=UPI0030F74FB0